MRKVPGASVEFDRLGRLIAVLLGLYLLKTLTQSVMAFALTGSIQSAMHDLRDAVEKKLARLPVKYFDAHPFGDVLSRVTNDLDTLSNGLQQTLMQILSGILQIILAFAMMLSINRLMAAVVFLIVPSGRPHHPVCCDPEPETLSRPAEHPGELNGAITEMYTGYKEIQLFNKQEEAVLDFEAVNEELRDNAFKAQFMSSLISPLVSMSTYLVIGVVAIIGCLLALNGSIQVGQIQAFVRYVWQVNDPMSQVSNFSAQIQAAFAALSRIAQILDEEELAEPQVPARLSEAPGTIVFEHVYFGYEPGKPIIRGPKPYGKTRADRSHCRSYRSREVHHHQPPHAILRCGQRQNSDGRHRYPGHDPGGPAQNMAMVLQDTWLFNGTIYDNLRYGRLDARRDEVIAAAKLAGVHHFIKTLPGGYDMIVNEEGSNISQGEKQLLTIARAILKAPQILILDEATSSVDTRLEKHLQEAMATVIGNRTSFIIAHRLSTIRNADPDSGFGSRGRGGAGAARGTVKKRRFLRPPLQFPVCPLAIRSDGNPKKPHIHQLFRCFQHCMNVLRLLLLLVLIQERAEAVLHALQISKHLFLIQPGAQLYAFRYLFEKIPVHLTDRPPQIPDPPRQVLRRPEHGIFKDPLFPGAGCQRSIPEHEKFFYGLERIFLLCRRHFSAPHIPSDPGKPHPHTAGTAHLSLNNNDTSSP